MANRKYEFVLEQHFYYFFHIRTVHLDIIKLLFIHQLMH